METWADIKGYEGLYQVSSIGQVRSLDRVVKHARYGSQPIKGRILKPFQTSTGYLTVTLYKNDQPKKYTIHRLVADAFIPPDASRPEVNHLNGIKWDNSVGNLERCTRSENMAHAYKYAFNTRALSSDLARSIRSARSQGITTRELADRWKVSQSTIYRILNFAY